MAPEELVLKRTLSAPEMPKEDGIVAVTQVEYIEVSNGSGLRTTQSAIQRLEQ